MKRRSPLSSALVAPYLLVLLMPAVAAAQEAGFGSRPTFPLVNRDFSDREVAALLATLDRLLASEKDPAQWGEHAKTVLWNFVRQLQTGRLTAAQEQLITKHLDAVARVHPSDAAIVGRARHMASALTIGKQAPDIVGKDLDGADFRLSDYRGKVVVLLFSADWCGICRTLNPYERLMQELYENWPFAILSVETGSSPEAVRKIKAEERLTYRSWWDVKPGGGAGPIASAWNVAGFPSIYVLDAQGVIRFVDLRYEDLLKAARQLLMEATSPIVRNQGGTH
jgi:peroxiredoxin